MNKRGLIATITAIISAVLIIFIVIGLGGCNSKSSSEAQSGSSISLPKLGHKEPVNIAGVYEFSDFDKKQCYANCKVIVEVSEDGKTMSVVASDDYGEYPMWYGSVDGQSIADKGKWVSKKTENKEELDKLQNSITSVKEKYFKFSYKDGNIVFNVTTYSGKNWHIVAKPMV